MRDAITSRVAFTDYSVTRTRTGKEALLVEHRCPPFETVKRWFFPGSEEFVRWWESRSSEKAPWTAKDAARLANIGKVRPTASITFIRAGRFPKVIAEEIGQMPEAFREFYRELDRLGFGPEVLNVRA